MNECCLNIQVKSFMNAVNECPPVTYAKCEHYVAKSVTFVSSSSETERNRGRVAPWDGEQAHFPASEQLWAYFDLFGALPLHFSQECGGSE